MILFCMLNRTISLIRSHWLRYQGVICRKEILCISKFLCRITFQTLLTALLLQSIHGLEGNKKLNKLYLYRNKIKKIENLSHLPILRILNLSKNRIDSMQVNKNTANAQNYTIYICIYVYSKAYWGYLQTKCQNNYFQFDSESLH